MRMTTEKQTKTTDEAARRRVVLVGTYRGGQLKNWPGWYCWPLDGEQCCQCENVASCQFQLPMSAKLATGNIGTGNIGTGNIGNNGNIQQDSVASSQFQFPMKEAS